MKSAGSKSKGTKKSAGNGRIKESGGNFWVLHKEHEIKKYRGFRNKSEGARPRRKKYSSPEVKVIGLEAGKKETKVVRFSDGKKKYGK